MGEATAERRDPISYSAGRGVVTPRPLILLPLVTAWLLTGCQGPTVTKYESRSAPHEHGVWIATVDGAIQPYPSVAGDRLTSNEPVSSFSTTPGSLVVQSRCDLVGATCEITQFDRYTQEELSRVEGSIPAGANRSDTYAYVRAEAGGFQLRQVVPGGDELVSTLESPELPRALAWQRDDRSLAVLYESSLTVVDMRTRSVSSRSLASLSGPAVDVHAWGDGFAILVNSRPGKSRVYRTPVLSYERFGLIAELEPEAIYIATGGNTEFLYWVSPDRELWNMDEGRAQKLEDVHGVTGVDSSE